MRMASLLASMPDLIQAVIPDAAWWRKYFRKALASADSGLAGLAAGLAAAGLAVTSWTTAAARAAGTAGWDVNAVVVAAVPSIAAATAVVSTNRFPPALAWILKFLCCMTAPGCCPVPDDLRLRARGCGTGTQTVAARWQHKTASCRDVAGIPHEPGRKPARQKHPQPPTRQALGVARYPPRSGRVRPARCSGMHRTPVAKVVRAELRSRG